VAHVPQALNALDGVSAEVHLTPPAAIVALSKPVDDEALRDDRSGGVLWHGWWRGLVAAATAAFAAEMPNGQGDGGQEAGRDDEENQQRRCL